MFTHFPQYYRITRKDLLDKFDDCVFMFDACALLDIFRLKKDVVKNIFEVIEHYRDKIYIPNHAAEEYNRNINKVLEEQVNKIIASKSALNSFVNTFQAQRNYPYITDAASKIIDKLRNQIEKDFSEQTKYLEGQLVHGGYQNKLSKLLEGNVLAPFNEEEIISIEKEGEERYSNKIPPGWKDVPKEGNRYGDLINWKEMLKFAKDNSKSVVFVSNDKKDDWLVSIKGKKIGIHPLLLKEFYDTMGNTNQLFQIYSLDSFLAFIKERDNSIVSDETVENVKFTMESTISAIKAFSDLGEQLRNRMALPEYLEQLQEIRNKIASSYRPLKFIGDEFVDMSEVGSQEKDNSKNEYGNETKRLMDVDNINEAMESKASKDDKVEYNKGITDE